MWHIPRIAGIKKKSQLDEIVERSLRQATIWDELKDRLHKSALGLSGGQQTETLYRKNTCGRAGSHIDGRTNFCTGSDFNI